MGRTAETPIIQHFIYGKEKNKSKCKYCPKSYEAKVVTNLRRHLESAHPEIYKTVIDEEESAKKRKCGNLILIFLLTNILRCSPVKHCQKGRTLIQLISNYNYELLPISLQRN